MKAKDVDAIILEILRMHVQEVSRERYFGLVDNILYENVLKELNIQHFK